MRNSRFYDSTGLSTRNVSTAQDLGKLAAAAYRQPLIRQFTQDENREMRFSAPAYKPADFVRPRADGDRKPRGEGAEGPWVFPSGIVKMPTRD